MARTTTDNLFAPLPKETRRLLDGIPALINKIFPLPGRFRNNLPGDVAELSRLLTSLRGERGLSYLGRPNLLSAYLRYFLPWNLYRLCRLLPGLDISLAANDAITDLGCGPLTFTAALWICRPDLRSVPLDWYCIDRSGPVLEAGGKFFAALAGENNTWKIHTVKGDFADQKFDGAKVKSAALVCAVNVFNEMYGDISRGGPEIMRRNAEKSVRILERYASPAASILVAEPGFPRCGEFISLMRDVFLEHGRHIVSPCPHEAACPFTVTHGKKGKERWCHFAFETKDAAGALLKLSQAAGFPKERAVLSFLFAGPDRDRGTYSKDQSTSCKPLIPRTPNPPPTPYSLLPEFARVISDAFPLPYNRYGRYCCSRQGLVLLAGEKSVIEEKTSGSLVNVIVKKDKRDPKSGALEAELPS